MLWHILRLLASLPGLSVADNYGARDNEMRSLAVRNSSWAAANDALQDLYETQETVTMRLTPNANLAVPATPGGTVCSSELIK